MMVDHQQEGALLLGGDTGDHNGARVQEEGCSAPDVCTQSMFLVRRFMQAIDWSEKDLILLAS